MSAEERRAGLIVGAAWPAGIALLAVLPWVIWWGELPDPIATHFDLRGDADGHLRRWVALVEFAAVPVVLAALLARTGRVRSAGIQAQAAILTFIAVTLASVGAGVVWANRGAVDWRTAELGIGWVGGMIGLSTGSALAVAALAAALVPEQPAPERALSPLALGEGQRAAWFGRAHSFGFITAAVAEAVVGTAILLWRDLPAVGITLLVIAAVLVPFAAVDVRVAGDGVRVVSALPWPSVAFQLHEIERAEAIDVRPTSWGGWGYRGSLRLFRRAAWVVRAGAALELHLVGGRTFTVTVDGADEAAAVVNGLLARGEHATRPS